MPLTQDDITKLRRPFAPEDHEFFNGYAYVAELAVCMRLEEVDPSYEFRLSSNPEPRTFVAEFVQVWQKATMTIKGVTRENTGMAKVESTKKGDREAGEPEKSSATDSLRRCARLFGVGQYLLNCPGWVQDTETMREWLDNGMQQTRGKRTQPAATSPNSRNKPQSGATTSNGAQNGSQAEIWPTEETVGILLERIRKPGGLAPNANLTDIARWASVEDALDVKAWAKYPSAGVAGHAIKAAYEAEVLAKLSAASPEVVSDVPF